MANDLTLAPSNNLIAGRYAVDTSQVLADAGGGIPACLARDRKASDGKRVALAVSRDASPRDRHLKLLDEPLDYLMTPLGEGVAAYAGGKGEGYFIVCTSPPGPPVSASQEAWSERALIDLVLKPVAGVLQFLHAHKLTHRAIRPNNVFQAAPGQPVTLGAAWAAPPAMHQPCVFESPYNAMCLSAARGEGSIADDVYSLGVLLLALSSGRIPMANMDDPSIIRWKLDAGSFAALTRDSPVSGTLAELLRAMLAEDPDHRPLPGALMDHVSHRGRRLAARPARRSQSPLMLNDVAVFDARTLAYGLLSDNKKAIQFLRNGLATQWLRRSLGDATLATQIEDLVRSRQADTKSGAWGDPLLVMRTISALNPRMPLCWRGLAVWPDALPSLITEGITAKGDLWMIVEELVAGDVFSSWSEIAVRSGHPDPPDLIAERQVLQTGGPAKMLRLFYGLNPLLPCRVPAMANRWVASIPDLLRFFENTAESAADSLIDLHIAAFIAAHGDRKIEASANALAGAKDAKALRSAELTLLRELQARYHPAPMPGLAKWVAGRLRPDLERWRNRPRREAAQAQLDVLAQAGFISRLLALAKDPVTLAMDSAGAQLAAREMALIDAELAAIDSDDTIRLVDAARFGRAIAGGVGLSVFILTAMSVMLR